MAKPPKAGLQPEVGADGKKVYLMDAETWENSESVEFGGQSDILELEVGEIAGPLESVGYQMMTLESGEIRVQLAITEAKDTLRMPISASFTRAFDQAAIQIGDTFAVKRNEDVDKKAGKGKGQTMHIYSIKVLKKGPTRA